MTGETIKKLVDQGAVFICNHSGGKDSQLMYAYLKTFVPSRQLFVIHAHLAGVGWPGTINHIKSTIQDLSTFYIVEAKRSFMQMVSDRGMFPSPKYRQCTSDLKRGPIDKKIRWICKRFGFTQVVNCMGLRADESSGRAKKPSFKLRKSLTTKARSVYDWLPIHDVLTSEVYRWTKELGEDLHWAYGAGMKRMSCVFCIMSTDEDIYTASTLVPELFDVYKSKERETGQSMMMPSKSKGRRFLDQIVSDYEAKKNVK